MTIHTKDSFEALQASLQAHSVIPVYLTIEIEYASHTSDIDDFNGGYVFLIRVL